jgi:hypothetical protein
MRRPRRRLISRRCVVCEWTGSAVETGDAVESLCQQCYAPTLVTSEEWLVDPVEYRAQAAEYGRMGGLKGGRIRAQRLSAGRRRDIARRAANARWSRKSER